MSNEYLNRFKYSFLGHVNKHRRLGTGFRSIGSVPRRNIAGDMGALNFVHFLLVLQRSDRFALVSGFLPLVFWSSGLLVSGL